jgi:5,5'-dehydrodivanillate O-demethylase
MFLTEEENRKLTQVGPGTPGGELLRRYWHPIAGLHEVSEASPTAMVRLLGEDLVLFRDRSGNVGLIQDHCAHRGASLLYGRVEERGIACAYHGWLYDTAGHCLECPAEPAGSKFHLTVKVRAYPVERLMGLYWAYLGPSPAPPIRRLDVGAYPVEHIVAMTYDANWVQIVENHVDSTHIYILHQDTGARKAPAPNTTRGWIDELTSLDYEEVPFGVHRKIVPEESHNHIEDDLVIFPNMLRRVNQVQIHAPIDDNHTRTYKLYFTGERAGDDTDRDAAPVDFYVLQDEGKIGEGTYPNVRYRMERLTGQDVMAIESQGGTASRSDWHLATGDRGVVLYERMLQRELERVQQGQDPVGVVRDPKQVIDTNYAAYLALKTTLQYSHEGLQVYARNGANGSATPRASASHSGAMGAGV